jgi:hypothetical protein
LPIFTSDTPCFTAFGFLHPVLLPGGGPESQGADCVFSVEGAAQAAPSTLYRQFLFTPIRLTAVACYASGPVKVRLSFWSLNVPHPPPKLLQKHRYICRHLVTVHFSQLTNTVLTLLALIIACVGVQCGLKYQHWPVK